MMAQLAMHLSNDVLEEIVFTRSDGVCFACCFDVNNLLFLNRCGSMSLRKVK